MLPFLSIALTGAVLVLGLVLRPLWRRSRASTAAVAALLVLTTAGLYALLGTPAALDATNVSAPTALPDALQQLEAALQRDPNQLDGWRLLGRSYASAGEPGKSRDAYARAAVLAPDQPDVLVEAAEASALADPQRRFDPAAVAMLRHALDVQPSHQRARWFLGITQFQAGKPGDAAATWTPLLAQVDPKTAEPLRAEINVARRKAGLPPLSASTAQSPTVLRVDVRLDPLLAARVRLDPDAVVFVIARVPNGPPMPVAVERHGVRELPFVSTLDDSDGPMPTQRLSAQSSVEVLARLSMSGNAMPQPGDIASKPVLVQLPAKQTVKLTIDAAAR